VAYSQEFELGEGEGEKRNAKGAHIEKQKASRRKGVGSYRVVGVVSCPSRGFGTEPAGRKQFWCIPY